MKNPLIIQGGMGIGISGWRLARAVSKLGHLGIVSGTGIDAVFARTLQRGDLDGHLRRAMDAFPDQGIASRIKEKYYRATPTAKGESFAGIPLPGAKLNRLHAELIVLANFVEVYLAKEDHDGLVGINLLEKIQVTTLPSLYGAMLAGVDYVIMGAGIPKEIPGALDKFALHQEFNLKLDVAGAEAEDRFYSTFSPREIFPDIVDPLTRPKFLAIVSSNALAMNLKKKSNGRVDGFVVETPTAGGHIAPPRGKMNLDEKGDPIFGVRDKVDTAELKKLELPFWMGGGYGSAQGLKQALSEGAEGIQAGTVFALCEESGIKEDLKRSVLEQIANSRLEIRTDVRSSPTGFPFKVAQMKDTCSEEETINKRPRRCDVGYLRKLYKKDDGKLGYRCSSEPEDQYVKKGGDLENTLGRKCLCNALLANLDLEQIHPNSYAEQPLITLGDDIKSVKRFISKDVLSYSAKDVIEDFMFYQQLPENRSTISGALEASLNERPIEI